MEPGVLQEDAETGVPAPMALGEMGQSWSITGGWEAGCCGVPTHSQAQPSGSTRNKDPLLGCPNFGGCLEVTFSTWG